MTTPKRWVRRSLSANNFDVTLTNPQDLNSERINDLLDRIQGERHRGLTLSARADKEFRRWSADPESSLRSEAYVLLSNWFLTQSGDRHSLVACYCENLWDELFPCRPPKRLSSPEPGRNHVMVPNEFEAFWKMILEAQGEDGQTVGLDRTIAHTPYSAVHSEAYSTIGDTARPSGSDEACTSSDPVVQTLTIAEAKAALARTFGVSPEKVEITIRG